jgi:hypothetical protein
MPLSPLAFLVYVICGAASRTRACADDRALPATDQSSGSSSYGCPYSYALGRFGLARLGIVASTALVRVG